MRFYFIFILTLLIIIQTFGFVSLPLRKIKICVRKNFIKKKKYTIQKLLPVYKKVVSNSQNNDTSKKRLILENILVQMLGNVNYDLNINLIGLIISIFLLNPFFKKKNYTNEVLIIFFILKSINIIIDNIIIPLIIHYIYNLR